MKRFCALVLSLMLVLCLASASAGTTVTTVDLSGYRYLYLNTDTDTLYGQLERNGGYVVLDPYGNVLSGEYDDITVSSYGFKTESGKGVNCRGYVNPLGVELVPNQYGDIEAFSENWQAGVVLTPATVDSYDYSTYGSEKQFYSVDHVDIYFRGSLVGTLSRNAYSDYGSAYGDYLYLKDREGNWHYYNSAFEESGYAGSYGSEYDSVYSKGTTTWYHCGSGQVAFAAGCTLTREEVVCPIKEVNGVLLDLQGNEIAVLQYDSIYSFSENGYARVANKQRLQGLIDMSGNEIIACLYDDLDYDGPRCGYISAVKDGKQGFVSMTDGSEQGFVYNESAMRVCSPFAYITDLDGSVIVSTGAVGALETRYADYRSHYDGNCPVAIVQDTQGRAGVIGLYGEEIVPLDGRYDSVYDLDVSDDGTVALGNDGIIYLIDYDLDTVQSPAAGGQTDTQSAPVEAQETVSAPAEAGDGWTCPSCGRENAADANFCPNDGTARP